MKIDKKYLEIGILVGMLILISSSVSAFAVSSAYWKENPIIISPGETKDIQLTLQNMAGTGDLNARGVITEGSEIAQITDADNIYLVPLGGKTPVNIQLSIPEDEEELEEEYILRISFTTLSTDAGGFGFGTGVERMFPVIIAKEPEPKMASWIIYLVVGALIIVLIIFSAMKKKKKAGK